MCDLLEWELYFGWLLYQSNSGIPYRNNHPLMCEEVSHGRQTSVSRQLMQNSDRPVTGQSSGIMSGKELKMLYCSIAGLRQLNFASSLFWKGGIYILYCL